MSTKNNFTPLHLEMMIHYHSMAEPFPRENSAVREYRNQLIHDGLLTGNNVKGEIMDPYAITDKGRAFVQMLLDTPLPIQPPNPNWIDPRL